MEKVTLAELGIGTDGLIKELARAKKEITELRQEQKKLDTTTKAGAEAFVKNEARIKSLNNETGSLKKALAALDNSTGGFLSVQEKLNSSLDKEINSIQGARDSNKELLAIRNKLNLNTAEGIKASEQINVKLDQNNKFIKENVSAYEKQKIGIGDYAGGIKEALKSQGSFNQSQNRVLAVFTRFAPVLKTVKNEFKGIISGYKQGVTQARSLAGAQKASALATNFVSTSLKLFRVALISTGIGAIVVALGSLIAFLTTTQAGIDKVTKVTKPLSVIFQRLFGVLQKLGGALFDTFSNPKQAVTDLWNAIKTNIVNRFTGLLDTFKALGAVIKSAFTLDLEGLKTAAGDLTESIVQTTTGVDDLAGKFRDAKNEASKFLNESIEIGNRLRDINIDIEQREAKIASQRAKANVALKEQELIAKDSSRSAAERNAAAEKAAQLLDEQILKEEAILELKIEELKTEQKLNDTSREDLKKLDELEAELISKNEERRKNELKFITAQTAFRKEQQQAAIAAEKKRVELSERAINAEIEQSKIRLEIYKKENESRFIPLADQISAEETLRDKKLDILNQELKAFEESQAFKNATEGEREAKLLEFESKRLDISKSFLNRQAEIAIEISEKELAAIQKKNESVLDSGTRVTEQLRDQELNRLSVVFNAEQELLQSKLDNKLINEDQFQQAQLELINQYKEQQLDVETKFEESRIQQKVANLQLELEIRRLNGESEFQLRLEELERERQAEIEKAESTGADIAAIEEKYALKKDKINKAEQKAKLDNVITTSQAISGLLKELSEDNKEIAIASAIIDGFLAVQKTLASVPFPANLVAATTIGVQTDKNVSEIRKAERGTVISSGQVGVLGGKSHARGGTPLYDSSGNMVVEAEKDEPVVVLNKKTKSLLPFLSMINQKVGGGIPLTAPVTFAARGGVVPTSSTQSTQPIDYDKLAEATSQINIQANINDINEANATLIDIDDYTTL